MRVCLLECGFKLNACVCQQKQAKLDKLLVQSSLEPHLTSALSAVVDLPLFSVLVHDAIMDADAVVDTNVVLYQLVLICL